MSDDRHVTARELADKLDLVRAENKTGHLTTRLLVLGAVFGTQLIPLGEVAQAAVSLL